MRRYEDPIEVRKGWIGPPQAGIEGPEQFLWRGRLWKVREVIAHWVETGPWWTTSAAQAVIGAEDAPSEGSGPTGLDSRTLDLLDEREIWRVEAGPGGPARDSASPSAEGSGGVFDLAFDWSEGNWQLIGCLD
jgi:Family of unknown function (DUF6504)